MSIFGACPANSQRSSSSEQRDHELISMMSHPFTREWPMDLDGQEIAFEFGAPGGVERIATCEVEVDFGSPLFLAVAAALGPFVSLPVP